jgi:hypothetical protein
MAKSNNILSRYTSLPILLDILSKKALPFSHPELWDDKNDSFYLEEYRKKEKIKTLLALCFTLKTETYHHWKVFADGISGVCIKFKKEEFLNNIDSRLDVKFHDVEYPPIQNLKSNGIDPEKLPFLKRQPFKDEMEFRIIYKNKSKIIEDKSINIKINCIDKITLNPWISDNISGTVKSVIKSIDGCSHLKVYNSRLINSKVWKSIATEMIENEKVPKYRHRRKSSVIK